MRSLCLLIPCLTLAACGSTVEPPGDDTPPTPLTTWYQDVAPIVAEHCMGCHMPGGIAPFSLATYADVQDIAPVMLDAVETGVMPPWDAFAADDCAPTRPWKSDPRLSPEEVDVLRAWIADGVPAGELATVPRPPVTDLADKTHSLTTEPYVTTGDTDEFVCFVLDPQTTTDTWLTAMQVRPGNAAVVHHAVISSLPAAYMPAAINHYGAGTPWPCSAGGAVPGSVLVGAWAPGGTPLDTAPEIGMAIEAGSGFILQIHYHPAGNDNDPDATSIDLRLQDAATPHAFGFKGFGNSRVAPTLQPGPNDLGYDDDGDGVEFIIPANVTGHTETMRYTIGAQGGGDAGSTLFMAFPHMHYVGTKIQAKVTRAAPLPGQPAEECLINVDRWDFTWQRSYQYDAPAAELPALAIGDTVEVKCTYDNTLANPYVQLALEEQGLSAPVDILMGEQTLDEMCIVLFGSLPANDP
jgi:hypothetical protein